MVSSLSDPQYAHRYFHCSFICFLHKLFASPELVVYRLNKYSFRECRGVISNCNLLYDYLDKLTHIINVFSPYRNPISRKHILKVFTKKSKLLINNLTTQYLKVNFG